MFAPTPPQRRTHFTVVAVIMSGVLLASLAGAWMLVRRHPGTRGQDILEQIRHDGLDAYWRGHQQEWMLHLATDTSDPGWEVHLRSPTEGGGFVGLDITATHALSPHGKLTWEAWTLDRQARRGVYFAGPLLMDRGRYVIAPSLTTEIRLDDGHLRVRQSDSGVAIPTEGPAPANYIPEGCVDLVSFVTAKRNRDASFQFIDNSVLPGPRRKMPHFLMYEMEPLADLSELSPRVAEAAAAVDVHLRGTRFRYTSVFDKQGRLLAEFSAKAEKSKEKGKTVVHMRRTLAKRRATRSEVSRVFRSAEEQVRVVVRLLARAKMLTFPLDQHFPGEPTAPGPEDADPADGT